MQTVFAKMEMCTFKKETLLKLYGILNVPDKTVVLRIPGKAHYFSVPTTPAVCGGTGSYAIGLGRRTATTTE